MKKKDPNTTADFALMLSIYKTRGERGLVEEGYSVLALKLFDNWLRGEK